MFINLIRKGQVNARPLASIMPWGFFRKLGDDALRAVFGYLRTLRAVKHREENTEDARYCQFAAASTDLANGPETGQRCRAGPSKCALLQHPCRDQLLLDMPLQSLD